MRLHVDRLACFVCALTAAVVLAACQETPLSPESLSGPAFDSGTVTKFTFTDVDINDDFQNIIIYAGTKQHDKKDGNTTCTYLSEGAAEYLGQYQEAVSFGADEAAAVLQFCIDNFGNRQ